jgi:hypothetical protein
MRRILITSILVASSLVACAKRNAKSVDDQIDGLDAQQAAKPATNECAAETQKTYNDVDIAVRAALSKNVGEVERSNLKLKCAPFLKQNDQKTFKACTTTIASTGQKLKLTYQTVVDRCTEGAKSTAGTATPQADKQAGQPSPGKLTPQSEIQPQAGSKATSQTPATKPAGQASPESTTPTPVHPEEPTAASEFICSSEHAALVAARDYIEKTNKDGIPLDMFNLVQVCQNIASQIEETATCKIDGRTLKGADVKAACELYQKIDTLNLASFNTAVSPKAGTGPYELGELWPIADLAKIEKERARKVKFQVKKPIDLAAHVDHLQSWKFINGYLVDLTRIPKGGNITTQCEIETANHRPQFVKDAIYWITSATVETKDNVNLATIVLDKGDIEIHCTKFDAKKPIILGDVRRAFLTHLGVIVQKLDEPEKAPLTP